MQVFFRYMFCEYLLPFYASWRIFENQEGTAWGADSTPRLVCFILESLILS